MLPARRLVTVLLALLGALVLPAVTPPQQAAAEDQEPKTYTWNDDPSVDGFGDGVWSKESNWEPRGVPQDGDIVIIEGDPDDHWVIQGIPDIELKELVVAGAPGVRLLRGERITVTDRMSLSGGVGLEIDVVVGPTAVADLRLEENPICHGGRARCAEIGQDSTLRVEGTLDLIASDDPADESELMLWGNSDVVIAPGGRLQSLGEARIHSGLCCSTGMSTVRNEGTITVIGSGLTTDHVDVDNRGMVTVAPGSTLRHEGGGFRSARGTYGGGGFVDVVKSYPVRSDAAEPGVLDGTFEVAGGLTLADGTTVRLGDWVEVTGVGRVDGDGAVRLAGPDLRGRLTFASGVDVATVPDTATAQRAHPQQLAGFHGEVTFAGGFDVVTGSSYVFDAGTVARVPASQVFAVQRGGTVTASSCCGNPAVLQVDPNATVRLGSEGGDEQAVFRLVRLDNPGRLELHNKVRWQPESAVFAASSQVLGWGTVEGSLDTGPAGLQSMQHLVVTGDVTMGPEGRLRTAVLPVDDLPRVVTTLAVGGTFHADGLLGTRGRTEHEPGTAADVVTAPNITGGFDCVTAPGWHPHGSATALTLTADGTNFSRCVHAAPADLLSGGLRGSRDFDVPGRPGAKWVQLRVEVSGSTAATSLEVGSAAGSATVQVPRSTAAAAHVIVPFDAANTDFAARLRTGSAQVSVEQVAAYDVRPDVDLSATGSITGRLTVAGAAPKPVRVEVWKEPADAADDEAATYPFDWVVTDPQGDFTLTGLPTGRYRVAVEHGLPAAWHENWLDGVDQRDRSEVIVIDSLGEEVERDFAGYRYGSRADLTVRPARTAGKATITVRVSGAHSTRPRGKVELTYIAERPGGGTRSVTRTARLARGKATFRPDDLAGGRRRFVATYLGTASHWSDTDRARARIR